MTSYEAGLIAGILIGVIGLPVVALLGAGIIATVQKRREEEEAWQQILERSPSETYWGNQATDQPEPEDEVYVRLLPPSPTPTPSFDDPPNGPTS